MLKDDIVKKNSLNMIIYVEVPRAGTEELVSQTVHIGLVCVLRIKKDKIAKTIQASFYLKI